MSSVNSNYQSSSNWHSQGTQSTQGAHKHHHHQKVSNQDSSQTDSSSTTSAKSSPTDILDSLVSNSTLSQDQENSIKSAFQSARKDLQSKLQSGTQGTSSAQDASSKPANPLDSLVSNGTITQDQETAIENTMKSAHHGHHHHEQVSDQPQEQTNSSSVQPTAQSS